MIVADQFWDTKVSVSKISVSKIETFYLPLGNDNDPANLDADAWIETIFSEGADRHECQNKTREPESRSVQEDKSR